MASREELQAKLEQILGTRSVYYQPPESVRMNYPAIKYSLGKIEQTKADNINYLSRRRYDIIVISRLPDNPIIEKILELPYSSYDRRYTSDNLYHDSLTLYF